MFLLLNAALFPAKSNFSFIKSYKWDFTYKLYLSGILFCTDQRTVWLNDEEITGETKLSTKLSILKITSTYIEIQFENQTYTLGINQTLDLRSKKIMQGDGRIRIK